MRKKNRGSRVHSYFLSLLLLLIICHFGGPPNSGLRIMNIIIM